MANTAMRAWSRPRWLKVYVFYIDNTQDSFTPFKQIGEALTFYRSKIAGDTRNIKRIEIQASDGFVTDSWTNPKCMRSHSKTS